MKTEYKNILIGVVDIKNRKAAQSSYGSGNAVAYYCHNGQKYPPVMGYCRKQIHCQTNHKHKCNLSKSSIVKFFL